MSKLTISDVQKAIEILKSQNKKISTINIRKITNTGSYSSIENFLKIINSAQENLTEELLPNNNDLENFNIATNNNITTNINTKVAQLDITATISSINARNTVVKQKHDEINSLKKAVLLKEQELENLKRINQKVTNEAYLIDFFITNVLNEKITNNIPSDLKKFLNKVKSPLPTEKAPKTEKNKAILGLGLKFDFNHNDDNLKKLQELINTLNKLED